MRRYIVLGIAAILFALLPFITAAQSDDATDGTPIPQAEEPPSYWSELRKFSRGRVVIRRENDAERRVMGVGTFKEFARTRTNAVTGAGQGYTGPLWFRLPKTSRQNQGDGTPEEN